MEKTTERLHHDGASASYGGEAGKKQVLNYETLLRMTESIANSKDIEEIMLITVESVTRAMNVKGCSLFLIDRKSHELSLGASFGLSDDYLNKGPVSALKSIARSLEEGPVAIYDVADDPRLQYPEEAKKEGISSILSVPIKVHANSIGTLRIYTAQPWDFTLDDVNFMQAVAIITGMSLETSRLYHGLKDSIEALKNIRDDKKKEKCH